MLLQPFSESDLAFMRSYAQASVPDTLLRGRFTEHEKALLEQVGRRQRVAKKLPICWANEQFKWPPTLHLEQSSSEKTAQFKASLIDGERLIDLSAGMGIDALYMASSVQRIDLVEPNITLSALSAYNLTSVMGISKAVFHGGETAELFLANDKEPADWIFLDPSRRSDSGQKVFKLNECSPNIMELLPHLLAKAPHILVKLSPMADVRQLQRELPCIKTVWALYTEGECKELLLLLEAGEHRLTRCAVDLDLNIEVRQQDGFGEQYAMAYSEPLQYIYEPNAAIHKLGIYAALAERYGLKKLHPDSNLFTSNEAISCFPGRSFLYETQCALDARTIQQLLPDKKANITVRNFPLTVAQVRAKSKLADGGSAFIFATTLIDQRKVLLICRKLPTT